MRDIEWHEYRKVSHQSARPLYVFSAMPVEEFRTFILTMYKVRAWCEEQFEAGYWISIEYEFMFLNEVDAAAFKLKWL